ncbi:peptidylprolyl isomerase [Candidatus Omnitrophota bacterium]
MKRVIAFVVMLVMCVCVTSGAKGEPGLMIEKGRNVAIDYTLTVEGVAVDSSKDRGPLQFVHGEGQIIPGLENRIVGMRAGEEKTVVVPPEEAYGAINPDALQEVPRSALPPDFAPKIGMMLQMKGPDGRALPTRVAQIKADTIVMDFNHLMAGKTLEFKVKIVSVE